MCLEPISLTLTSYRSSKTTSTTWRRPLPQSLDTP